MGALPVLARGDAPILYRAPALPSPLKGVSSEAWRRFVRALETQALDAVTESRGLGLYEMRPRRLGDLGIAINLRPVRKRTADGRDRQVWECDFAPPLTEARFLKSVVAQYNALATSMERYDTELGALPEGVTRSGALALLHRGCSLKSWSKSPFPATVALFERANGIF